MSTALFKHLLPNRLTDRPVQPPSDLLSGVGQGDYWEVGEATVDLLEKTVGLEASDRILDIGCGLGRIAWPLSARLGRRGRYSGLDACWSYVNWCNENLGLNPARFWFHHLDVSNSAYNPDGKLEPDEARFPYGDGSFDLAIATSLFTHLRSGAVVNYLAEVDRVLRDSGRLFSTFFLIDPESSKLIEESRTAVEFTSPFEVGMFSDRQNPDAGVAYSREWLFEQFEVIGLEITGFTRGSWRNIDSDQFQDVVMARPGVRR